MTVAMMTKTAFIATALSTCSCFFRQSLCVFLVLRKCLVRRSAASFPPVLTHWKMLSTKTWAQFTLSLWSCHTCFQPACNSSGQRQTGFPTVRGAWNQRLSLAPFVMVGDPPPPPAEQPAEQEAAAGAVGGGGGAGEAAVEAVAAGAAATAATAPTHVLNQERFNVFNEGLLFYATYSLLLLLALMVVVGELRLTKRLPTLLFLPTCLLLPLLLCCFIASIPCKPLVKPNSTLVPGYTHLPGVQNFWLSLFFIPLIYTLLLPPQL